MPALAPNALPESLQELIDSDVLSINDVILLVEQFHPWVWIPPSLDAEHPISQTLGLERAQRLSQHCGYERLKLPRCKKALTIARNAQILSAKRGGQTRWQLCRHFRLSPSGLDYALEQALRAESPSAQAVAAPQLSLDI